MYGLKYRNQSNTNYVRKPEYDSKCKKTPRIYFSEAPSSLSTRTCELDYLMINKND